MSRLKEADRICLCKKCLAANPGGVELSAKAYRAHQLKRWPPDSDEDNIPTESWVPTPSTSFTPTPSAVDPPPPTDQSMAAARLDVQDIRYAFASATHSFKQPQRLEFTAHEKTRASREGYTYQGVFNEAPFALTYAPVNTPFLHLESKLHGWAEGLQRLKTCGPQEDHNYQLQVQSVLKEVTGKLNQMFAWKVEIFERMSTDGTAPGYRRIIDTTRYLHLYHENGDPAYSRIILAGHLLVLTLYLIFNTPQAVCDVVLAFLLDQANLFSILFGRNEHSEFLRAIPRSIKTVEAMFDLDPVVKKWVVCPSCYALSPPLRPKPKRKRRGRQRASEVGKPLPDPSEAVDQGAMDPGTDTETPELRCMHKETPNSPPCDAKLTRSRIVNGENETRPIKEYLEQDFAEWIGQWMCRPDVVETLRRRREEFRERKAEQRRSGSSEAPGLAVDILESRAIEGFPWPDGKPWYDCDDDEYRLLWSFTADGFNPGHNLEAKQTYSSTGIYLFCLNLPLDERQKPHNIFLAGVIPGPDKPSTSQINHYTSLLVDSALPLYNPGVRYTDVPQNPTGIVVRSTIATPVVCDALGARQICGYGSITSRFFCTFCWLPISALENFDKATWPPRNLELHRFWAEQWKDAEDEATRGAIFEAHGIRYAPFLRLPYFNPITFTIVDTMHNFFLGLLQKHCRLVWGMDIQSEDGDGAHKSDGTATTPPPEEKLKEARRALEFRDIERLAKSGRQVLLHLCLELDLRRAGRKRDLIRELLRWRTAQGAFLPESWGKSDNCTSDGSTEPASHTHTISTTDRTPRTRELSPQSAAGSSADSPRPADLRQTDATGPAPQVPPPASVPFELLKAGEETLTKGLKIDGIRKAVLFSMCVQRGLSLPINPQKQPMIDALNKWRGEQPAAPKKRKKGKRSRKAVLGTSVLTSVSQDMERTVLPRWVDRAPARVGYKKQGKLSADQWRSFCSIHLVITLICLWGTHPEDSRWYQMLANFLDLVLAVELGSMLATSSEHAAAYETVITRYLVNMKSLYKEAIVVPNHHLALHVPDFTQLWGPSPQSRGFGWERFNHTLQQINTNKRFGEIEKTFMYTATRAANLLSLLSLTRVRDLVANMYTRIQGLVNADARGTRLHDLLGGNPQPTTPDPVKGRPTELDPAVVVSLSALLNSGQSEGESYVPAHISQSQIRSHRLLHPSATLLPSIKLGGATFRPFKRSLGDSNILLRDQGPHGIPYQPARLEAIFLHQRVVGPGLKEETFCVVRALQPLSLEQSSRDPYRKFSLGGSLWSQTYDPDAALRVVRPSTIHCHFARTSFDVKDTEMGCRTFHVLPLDRFKLQVGDVGERVRDTFGQDGAVHVEEDDEDDEEAGDDDDMEADM